MWPVGGGFVSSLGLFIIKHHLFPSDMTSSLTAAVQKQALLLYVATSCSRVHIGQASYHQSLCFVFLSPHVQIAEFPPKAWAEPHHHRPCLRRPPRLSVPYRPRHGSLWTDRRDARRPVLEPNKTNNEGGRGLYYNPNMLMHMYDII